MSDDNTPSSAPEADASVDTQESSGKSKVQQRIDSLIKKSSEADARATSLQAENTQLLDQISRLSHQLEEMKVTPPEPAAPKANSSLTGSGAPAVPDTSRLDELVQSAVSKALEPILEEGRQRNESRQFATQQQLSFEKAAKDMPGLRNAESQEFQLFEQLFNNRKEFLESSDGPQLAAEVVRGILSDARREQKDTEQRKTNAAVVQPRSRGPIPDDADTKAALEAREAIRNKVFTKHTAVSDLKDYLDIELATARIRENKE